MRTATARADHNAKAACDGTVGYAKYTSEVEYPVTNGCVFYFRGTYACRPD